MTELNLSEVEKLAHDLAEELLARADAQEGDIFVVGCSSSEILGGHIGKASSEDLGSAVARGVLRAAKEHGVYLAAQCCEHLNRALVIEAEAARRYNLLPVTVVPQPKAGGSFATAVYRCCSKPVMVEHIVAKCGLDIGQTLIGMHIAHVAIPIRLASGKLGSAIVTAAGSRPKLIGGARAVYDII